MTDPAKRTGIAIADDAATAPAREVGRPVGASTSASPAADRIRSGRI